MRVSVRTGMGAAVLRSALVALVRRAADAAGLVARSAYQHWLAILVLVGLPAAPSVPRIRAQNPPHWPVGRASSAQEMPTDN